MPERKLGVILEELHAALADAQDLDDSVREDLRGTAVEIQTALDGESAIEPQLTGVRERIERFETDHPRLTEAVRRLVDQLSEMGI